MGKYKIGDRVRVRSDMIIGGDYGVTLNSGMAKYIGKETTISGLDGDSYFLEIDARTFYWHEKMLEPASKFKVGDRVKVKVRTGREIDYPCGFIDEMTKYSGEEFQIESVDVCTRYSNCKYYEEPFEYELTGNIYCWSSPMLELVTPINELASVTSDKCNTADASVCVADYVVDGICIVPSSSKESKSEYIPDYKLETQNNYNLNFNLK